LCFLPWVPSLVEQVTRVQSAFWIPPPRWFEIFHPFVVYTGFWPLALMMVPLALWGVDGLSRVARTESARSPSPAAVLAAWIAAPIVLPFVLSHVGSPIFLGKYTIAASVPFAVLTAIGYERLRVAWTRWTAAGLIGALSIWGFALYYVMPAKDDWRQAVRVIEETAQPGDAIVFYPWFNQVPFAYYQKRTDLPQFPFVAKPDDPEPAAGAIPALADRAARRQERLWLIVLKGTRYKSTIVDELGRRMTPLRRFELQHVEGHEFARRP
jgi:hypothetical protein